MVGFSPQKACLEEYILKNLTSCVLKALKNLEKESKEIKIHPQSH